MRLIFNKVLFTLAASCKTAQLCMINNAHDAEASNPYLENIINRRKEYWALVFR
jgi:hypothetical protein